MILLFSLISAVGMFYFLVLRKRFDFYSLGYASSVVYFLPGYFGTDLTSSLAAPVYAVFILVLTGITAGAILNDTLRRGEQPYPATRRTAGLSGVIALSAFASFGYVLVVHGPSALLVSKTVSGIPGVVYIVWRTTASLSAIYGALARKRIPLVIGVVSLGAMFIAHDRTAVAMVFLAVITHFLRREHGSVASKVDPRWVLPAVSLVALLWTGKTLHGGIQAWYRTGDTAAFAAAFHAQRISLTGGEPFAIQMILNAVITEELYIGPAHLEGALVQFWPVPSMLGYSSSAFNEIVQSELFPSRRPGSMAYNFWAEGIASGGWFLLAAYVVLYVLGLTAFNRLSANSNLGWRGLWLLMGAYWAFYIHRNSLASILTFERHIFLFGVCILWFVALLPKKRPLPMIVAFDAPRHLTSERQFDGYDVS